MGVVFDGKDFSVIFVEGGVMGGQPEPRAIADSAPETGRAGARRIRREAGGAARDVPVQGQLVSFASNRPGAGAGPMPRVILTRLRTPA